MAWFLPILGAIGQGATAAGSAIGSAAGTAGSALGSAAGGVGSALGTAGTALGEGASAAGTGLLDALGSAGTAVGDAAGFGGEAGVLRGLGQAVPQGVDLVGPSQGLSGAELATMFPAGQTMTPQAGMLTAPPQAPMSFQQPSQSTSLQNGFLNQVFGSGGQQMLSQAILGPDLIGMLMPKPAQQQEAPPLDLSPGPQLPYQRQDPTAFLRAFSLQG